MVFRILCTILVLASFSFSYDSKWMAVGALHNWYSEVGCEVEIGRTGYGSDQQDGLRYPAQDEFQDSQVYKGLWIGSTNYFDPLVELTYPHKVVSIGPRGPIDPTAIIPVEFQMQGRFPTPQVIVDGVAAGLPENSYSGPVVITPDLSVERMLINTVHTSMGVSMTRKIQAFSHPQHDNYMIYDYVFKNTGIIDSEGTINPQTLTDLMFFWLYKYAVNREGGPYGSGEYWLPLNATWGTNTMNEVIGENPDSEDPFRAFYSWHGLHSLSAEGHNNIGGPYYGTEGDGHLSARQLVGGVTLHADTAPGNADNDTFQPTTTQYLGSDEPFSNYQLNQYNTERMSAQYAAMSAGHPGLSHAESVGDGYANDWGVDPGGYTQTQGFGPYTLEPGDSIHIVIAEGAAGISRELAYSIGATWLNGLAPYELPDGSTTTDADEYKNTWVFTGVDSLLQTFQRAMDTYDSNYEMSLPPPPPDRFEVIEEGDRVGMLWSDNAEDTPGFAGYRIFRAVDEQYGDYEEVFACGLNTENPDIVNVFEDQNVTTNHGYYYYIVAFDDGSNNSGIPLQSSEFWTRTSRAVQISGRTLVDADLYVSPTGNNDNDGLTPDTPLKTIVSATGRILHNVLHPHTIHLAEGVYSASVPEEHFPVSLGNYLTLAGAGSHLTILNGEGLSRVLGASGENVVVRDLTITNGRNNDSYYGGGGLRAYSTTLLLQNVIIRNNWAIEGGGVYLAYSDVSLENVSIFGNTASYSGGGLFLDNYSEVELNSTALSCIYSNAGVLGSDLATGEYRGTEVVSLDLDTFSVEAPSDYVVFPAGYFSINMNHSIDTLIDANLYVSPTGDDGNSGLSRSEPLKTIRHAIKSIRTTAENPHTIFLDAGTYSPSSNGEAFPLYFHDNLTLTGDSLEESMLDGEDATTFFRIIGHSNSSLKHLSLRHTRRYAINCYASELELDHLLIEENRGGTGGGIYSGPRSSLFLSSTTIRYNLGNGLYVASGSEITFDPVDRCNIYFNHGFGYTGRDIRTDSYAEDTIMVVLDTCTQLIPTAIVATPIENFTFDILNQYVHRGAHDLYVSPEGDDGNSGLSVDDPLNSLSFALDLIYVDDEVEKTIYLADGIYSPSLTGETFPLNGKNLVSIVGASVENCILDGDSLSSIFEMNEIQNFNVQRLTIQNGFATTGGAIVLTKSSPSFRKVLFVENHSENGGGAMSFMPGEIPGLETRPVFMNCTFVNNVSGLDLSGVLVSYAHSPTTFINCLFWGNGRMPLLIASIVPPTMVNTLIEEGETAVMPRGNWIGPVIDADPNFVGGESFSFELTGSSPAINAGVAFFELDGDTLLNLSPEEYIGFAPDIGALESPYLVDVKAEVQAPRAYRLNQNYPNPFNPNTTISYEIPESSDVSIKVFDLRGRLVWFVSQSHNTPGIYEILWQGIDSYGLAKGSGVYVVQMVSGDFQATQKILLIK